MRSMLVCSLVVWAGVCPALAQTVTDYYPQAGGPGSTVTVHISGLAQMKEPTAPEAVKLYINGQPLTDVKAVPDVRHGRVAFTLLSSDASRHVWSALRNGERVVLSAGWEKPLAVTALPLTDDDRRDGQRKFRIETEPSVTDFYPSSGGIGAAVTIHVTGLRALSAPNTPETAKLYLNGRAVPDSKPRDIDLRNGRMTFDLLYTDASKEAWRSVLGLGKSIDLSVGWNKEGALPVTALSSGGSTRQFRLDPGRRLAFFAVLFAALLLIFVLTAVKSNLLRTRALSGSATGSKPYAFSLGRCQMAWWTFITMGSALFVWLLTGRFQITEHVLVLMGISAATALGAVTVDASKQAGAAAATARAVADLAQTQTAAAAIQASAEAATPASPHLAVGAQHVQHAVAAQHSRLAALATDASPPPSKNSFVTDILSDENGISFHRFQIAAWTLVLGLYFVVEVTSTFEMPAFPAELLTLMGISSSTYLGFKFPERRG